MTLPYFQAGEVLSAVKLNSMVAAINRIQNPMLSMTQPFEQVEANAFNISDTGEAYWAWMFRYIPSSPYYRLRYTWGGRSSGATARGGVKGAALWYDNAGGANGVHAHDVNLGPSPGIGLQPGKIYTYEIWAKRDTSTFFRVDYLFMTNNAAFAPTIIGP